MNNPDYLNSLNPNDLLFLTKISEQSDRYNDMLTFIKAYIRKTSHDLSKEEQMLFSGAFYYISNLHKHSIRVLKFQEIKEEQQNNISKKILSEKYREKIEIEFLSLCKDLLIILEENLLPRATNSESRGFYLNLRGIYYSKMFDSTTYSKNAIEKINVERVFNEDWDKIKNDLSPAHPLRLGYAVKIMEFYFEIMLNTKKSCEIAKNAADEAICDIENLSQENRRDSEIIIKLLKENIELMLS
ncbi:hypothetical protein SteCoe_18898 [Stentor coeruleus]|uniref:14-3-3 domain-containing protein n=1 Tax=Stentor coeruleus TaxID=5963 RepID=A0A1R2BVJ1_9CILI|nr:hypothetical protein SteCoe_18898 [Stentor coeruleus]